MLLTDPNLKQAELKYGDSSFKIVKHGHYVPCAVTGARIPINDLKYWSVERQEAYSGPEASLARHRQFVK